MATLSTKVEFNAEGTQVVSACFDDGYVKVWDVETGKLVQSLGLASGFLWASFSPKGTWIAAAGRDLSIRVWNVKTGATRHALRGPIKDITDLAFSADERNIACTAGTGDDSVTIWDVGSGKEVAVYRGHDRGARTLSFRADGQRIMTLDGTGVLREWDATRGAEFRAWTDGRGAWYGAVSHDGSLAAASCMDVKLRVWRGGSGELLHTFGDDKESLWVPAFHPDGEEIAVGTDAMATGSVKFFSLRTGKLLREFPDPKKELGPPVCAVAYNAKGTLLASGGCDRKVRVWDPHTGKTVHVFGDHSRSLSSVAFSADGKRLASGTGGKEWSFFLAKNPLKLKSDDDALVPDVKVWDLDSGKEVLSLSLPGKTAAMAFSPDGKTVAAGFKDATIRFFDVDTGKERLVLRGHSQPVNGLAFSKDGKRLVSGGGSDESVKLWDAATGQELLTLGRGPDMLTSVAFSPDGRSIIATSFEDTRVWSLKK